MTSEYDSSVIEVVLTRIGSELKKKLVCYIFGGAVMVFLGLKPTTKDIDAVFDSQKTLKKFVEAIQRAGFVNISLRGEGEPYGKLVFEEPISRWRLEVFNRGFFNKLVFSKSMIQRSTYFKSFGKLESRLLSIEDIFILKSITERERDLDDMRLLVPAGIDWDILGEEILYQESQREHSILTTVPRIEELSKRYNISFELPKKVITKYDEVAEEWIREKEKRKSNQKSKETNIL